SLSTDRRLSCNRTMSAWMNSSGGLAPRFSASSWALRRCTVSAPAAATAPRPRTAPTIHHLVLVLIFRRQLSAAAAAFSCPARRRLARPNRVQQRHERERDAGIRDYPDEAVVAPGPPAVDGELGHGEDQQRLARAPARRGERAARKHRPSRDADGPHRRLPERFEPEAVDRAAERRAERQRHKRYAPAAPRILVRTALQYIYGKDGSNGSEQVVRGERHRLADHGVLVACTRISPRASSSSGCWRAR